MSVNLSGVQFNDMNLVQIVQSAIDESGLDPQLLELELTESVAMSNIEKNLKTLEAFQRMGVSIAIDDFGSGYSSLDHIRYLPTNSLKIDRAFIRDLKHEDSAIVAAIITMAHQLRLKVVAEGVETQEQFLLLTNINCDQVQGNYLGKAIPSEQVWEMFSKSEKNVIEV
jgi:EAL domain-containing protein (putative c-di-GMP-specific phosphodiesterase class I)